MSTDTSPSSQASDDFIYISRSLLALDVDDSGTPSSAAEAIEKKIDTVIAIPTHLADVEPDDSSDYSMIEYPIKEEEHGEAAPAAGSGEVRSYYANFATMVDAESDTSCDYNYTVYNDSINEEFTELSPKPIARPTTVKSKSIVKKTVADASPAPTAQQGHKKKVLFKNPVVVKSPTCLFSDNLMTEERLLKEEIRRAQEELSRAQAALRDVYFRLQSLG